MFRKRLLFSIAHLAVLALFTHWASAQMNGPLFVLKGGDGSVRPDSVANLEMLRDLSAAPTGVRIWVTFDVPYEPNLLPGTEAYEKQARAIERAKRKIISRLEKYAPSSRDYEHVTIGPHFAVVTDPNGIDFLVSERKVTRIFGPV